MNVLWCAFNVVIVGVCIAVAREMRQLRTSVRINVVSPVTVRLPDGRPITANYSALTSIETRLPDVRPISGETIDMSSGGTSIRFAEEVDLMPESKVMLRFPHPAPATELPGSVVSSEGTVLRVRFDELTIAEQEVLTMVLYSRADSWLGWGESRESDNVLRSLGRIFQISFHGLIAAFRMMSGSRQSKATKAGAISITSSAGIIALTAILIGGAMNLHGQVQGYAGALLSGAPDKNAPVPQGQFHDSFTLNDAGSPQIELHGIDSRHEIYFTLPQTHVVRTAKIHVYYAFSPSLLPQLSHLKLMMNGTLFATVQPTPGQLGGSDSQDAEAEFTIPR
jgi:cellulose synthase (UDP-forming)